MPIDITELQPTPRQSRAASAAVTADLENLFQQLDDALNNLLDSRMVKFESSNPAFYHEYQTARSIVDRSASHEARIVEEPVLKAA